MSAKDQDTVGNFDMIISTCLTFVLLLILVFYISCQNVSSADDALITSLKYFLVPGLFEGKAYQGVIVAFCSNGDD